VAAATRLTSPLPGRKQPAAWVTRLPAWAIASRFLKVATARGLRPGMTLTVLLSGVVMPADDDQRDVIGPFRWGVGSGLEQGVGYLLNGSASQGGGVLDEGVQGFL
jgi:hypothetical protein